MEIGTKLTAVAMGIDAYERTRPIAAGLAERQRLVPIYLGHAIVESQVFIDWAAIDTALTELDAAPIPAGPRQVCLAAMASSLKAASQVLRGEAMTYAEKLHRLVGAPAGLVPPIKMAELTERVSNLLDRCGMPGSVLHDRVAAWEAQNAIPQDRLEAEFRALMTEAKRRTDAAIFPTGDHDMALAPVHGTRFTARCNFAEGRMELNVDNVFTRAALKHLVCHEVYPGHATQLLSTRAAVVAGVSGAEALLCTANTVAGCVQEGIGDQAVHLIDWIEDDHDNLQHALRCLRSAAQSCAGWQLMAEHRPAAEVADYLRHVAAGQEAWVAGRLRMAAHPFQGPFIASYWHGQEAVRQARKATSAEHMPKLIRALFDELHTPESLAQTLALPAASSDACGSDT